MTTSTRRIWAGLRGGLAKTLATAVVLLGMCSLAAAQGGAEGTTPPFLKPGLPAGTYPLSGFDSVNLFNGNLNFHLPLMEIAGRGGARIPIMKKIEARWRVVTDVPCSPCSPVFYPTYNWWTGYTVGYGPGIMEGRASTFGTKFCTFGEEIPDKSLLRLTFTGADGTEYELRDHLTDGAPQPIPDYPNCPNFPWFDRGTVFVTADGSSATFFSCAPDGTPIPLHDSDAVLPSGVLLLRDGTRYRIDAGLVSWIQDRNGNRISFFYEHTDPQGQPDGRVTRIIDSLNRQVTISYDVAAGAPYGTCDEISFQGFGGLNRKIRVSKDLMSNVLRSDFTGTRTYHDLFPNFSGSSFTQFDDFVTSAVWLPDGRSYKFYYNDYGELSRVVLPTGGAVEYDWGEGMINALTGGYNGRGGIYRRVLERRVYPNGASGVSFASKETYSVPETYVNGDLGPPPNAGYVFVKQFDSNLNLLTASKHYFNGSAVYNPNEDNNGVGFYYPWNNGKEYKTEALDADGFTVLQRAEHTFDQTAPAWWNPSGCTTCIPPANNPRITQTLTTWVQTNQVAKQSYSYDQYNNKTIIQEFDYGAGGSPANPRRRTEIDYVTIGETNGIDYTGSSIAANVNTLPYLRSLPKEQRVFSVSSTGATTLQAKTHFYYDEYALTNRASITGWQSPVTAARGNLTSASQWLDTPAPATWITTTQKYDIAGHVVETTDAKGNTSQIDFASSSNTYAFPTTFKTPVPDPTGQRGSNARLETSVDYDFSSGLVKTITDPNGQVTTASYTDALDRLTAITRPSGGGQTAYFYGDSVGNLYLRTQTAQNATQTLENYQYFDGLGRTTIASQTEASGSIFAETQYDALGRVSQVSNPYRAADTKRWTVTQYDALNRVLAVTKPGGAVTTNAYSGNSVTITDPATKSRKTVSDALGRVTSVIEDPGTSPHLNYQTNYTYDALDNLRKVVQGSQTRYFAYDSLKRLIRVKNPEQDVNSNLPAFTDPVTSNSQWAIAFTYDRNSNLASRIDPRNISCTYGYDAMNRVLTRTFSGETTPTRPVDYKYDGAGTTAQNALGKLTAVNTSGSFVSSYIYDNFDAMGRVLHSTQSTDGNAYGMSYGYDLAGNLTSETYPSGRIVSTALDVVGRINDVSSGTTHYASSFSYAAHGGVTDVKLGNNLWEHMTFEPNRLQPTEIGLGATQGASDKLKLNYDYGPLTTNNGDVMSQTITIPGGPTLTQSYTYDGVNRLFTAQENSGTSWKQAFLYDACGNRTIDMANTTASIVGPNPQISATTNRIVTAGYSYDFAGNLKTDAAGHTYDYDAENMQVKYDTTAAQYSYDGGGRRVKSVTNNQTLTTIFVYDAMGKLLAEYTNTNPTGGGTSYLTTDALGSTRIVTGTNTASPVKARHDYLPFGEEISVPLGGRTTGQGYVADNVRQKFTGQQRDVETGLDYFGARYYSCATGRFSSADSVAGNGLNPQSMNLYAYVMNNPLVLVDPTGNITESEYDGTDDKLKQLNDQAIAEERARQYEESLTGYTEEQYERDNLSGPSATENNAAEQPQQAQSSTQPARYLILVGEQGQGQHDVGTNFMRVAETRKEELESWGNEAIIVPVGSVTEVSNALLNNGQITGGVIFYGHAGVIRGTTHMVLAIGSGAGRDTNLDSSNVWKLDGRNLGPRAVIELNGCHSGLPYGGPSLAQLVADQLKRWTKGSTTAMAFSDRPGVYPNYKTPPSTGPLYMVPAPPGKLVGFNHYHR